MRRPDTYLVTPTRGPRPNGKPTECFYCHQTLGAEHKPECVMRDRTIVARYSYDVVVRVPEHWTKDNFEFHRNMGTSCANNTIDDMKLNTDAMDAATERHETWSSGPCWCGKFNAEYLREADADEDALVPSRDE